MTKRLESRPFHSIKEELQAKALGKTAFTDLDFLLRDELRPVRLQLELLKPELILQDNNIKQTIVFFGSARLPTPDIAKQNFDEATEALSKNPKDKAQQRNLRLAQNILDNVSYLEHAEKLAYLVSTCSEQDYHVVTGGGPAFMEAANKGAYEAKKKSLALNVMLPHEQVPNPYVTPELTFQFHYFAIRKMHFLLRAKALVAFPGGFGTLDELFESLTLLQTEKIDAMPLILFNERFWHSIINFEGLVEEGTISEEDLNLFHFVETADEAWKIIDDFYK